MISYDPQKLLEDKRSPYQKIADAIDFSDIEARILAGFGGGLVENLTQARSVEMDLALYGEAFIGGGRRISPDEVAIFENNPEYVVSKSSRFARTVSPKGHLGFRTSITHRVQKMPEAQEIRDKFRDNYPEMKKIAEEMNRRMIEDQRKAFFGDNLGTPWDPTKYQKD